MKYKRFLITGFRIIASAWPESLPTILWNFYAKYLFRAIETIATKNITQKLSNPPNILWIHQICDSERNLNIWKLVWDPRSSRFWTREGLCHGFGPEKAKCTHENCTLLTIHLGPAGQMPALGLVLKKGNFLVIWSYPPHDPPFKTTVLQHDQCNYGATLKEHSETALANCTFVRRTPSLGWN